MRFHSYFNSAVLVIRQYDGKVPLTHFLKAFFAKHKKYGSKDRKAITHLCYTYFRIGHALQGCTVEEKLKAAIFIITDNAGDWEILFEPDWIANWHLQQDERIKYLLIRYPDYNWEGIFQWTKALSNDIDVKAFVQAHFQQPDLFLRIRPDREARTYQHLKENSIGYEIKLVDCIALPNGTKIDTILAIDQDVVIQDISSQGVASFLLLIPHTLQNTLQVWDCCAASGGKSILAMDILKNMELMVSDIRPSILQNLKKRFTIAGINRYTSFLCDLSVPQSAIPKIQPDLIICDAPCSGSGTWGRTPEQLFFFKEDQIIAYAKLQKKILENIIPVLKKGGHLLYITCSVFQAENEAIVKFIQEEHGLALIKAELLKGYEEKGDTMFAALFCK